MAPQRGDKNDAKINAEDATSNRSLGCNKHTALSTTPRAVPAQSLSAMSQPLTPFYPIFASKSDGLDVVNQKGSVVRNGPTQEQLDRSPNAQGQCDYYRLIEKDDPKHIDWRKKLGGMLLREIGGKQHEGGDFRRWIVWW